MLLLCAKYSASEKCKNATERKDLRTFMSQCSRAWPHPVGRCLIRVIRQPLCRNRGRRNVEVDVDGAGRGGKEKTRQAVCPKKWKWEVWVRTLAKPEMGFYQFSPCCSPSHAHTSQLCHREASETRFLFCSSRNVGHPDKLAFHWQHTAESSSCGSFSQSLQCECVSVCLLGLHSLCYQPNRPYTEQSECQETNSRDPAENSATWDKRVTSNKSIRNRKFPQATAFTFCWNGETCFLAPVVAVPGKVGEQESDTTASWEHRNKECEPWQTGYYPVKHPIPAEPTVTPLLCPSFQTAEIAHNDLKLQLKRKQQCVVDALVSLESWWGLKMSRGAAQFWFVHFDRVCC